MIVITIIGMMAATVMPAMGEMIANQRQHSIAVDIASLARRARDAAVLGGKYAYAIAFEQASAGGDGAVQVITGATSQCYRGTGVPINTPFDVITVPVGWQTTIGSVSMRGLSFGGHRVMATMEMPQGTQQNQLRICYTPYGETWAFSPSLPGGGGEQTMPAVLYVRRQHAGGAAGVPREIVFLPGGTARLR